MTLQVRHYIFTDKSNLLINNNYPPQIIENEFNKYEKYKQLNVEKVANPNEKIKYLSYPSINDKSDSRETVGRERYKEMCVCVKEDKKMNIRKVA